MYEKLPVTLGLLLCFGGFLNAQTRHRVVVDMFSGGRPAYESALGNVVNLKKALGAEGVQVEVVCYGKGIDLVLAKDNFLAGKVVKLQKQGVTFAACKNTMRVHRLTSKDLLPSVRVVNAGIAEIVLKEEQGWSYIRR